MHVYISIRLIYETSNKTKEIVEMKRSFYAYPFAGMYLNIETCFYNSIIQAKLKIQ